jgi:hypothetical protein
MKTFIVALLTAAALGPNIAAAERSFSAILWGYDTNSAAQSVFGAGPNQGSSIYNVSNATVLEAGRNLEGAFGSNTLGAVISVGKEATIFNRSSDGEFASLIFPGAASTGDLQSNTTNENSAMVRMYPVRPAGLDALSGGEFGLFRYMAHSRTLADDINGISQISHHAGPAKLFQNTTHGVIGIPMASEARAFERNNIAAIAGLPGASGPGEFIADSASILPMIDLPGAPSPFALSIHKLLNSDLAAAPVPEPPPFAIGVLSLVAFAFLIRRRK